MNTFLTRFLTYLTATIAEMLRGECRDRTRKSFSPIDLKLFYFIFFYFSFSPIDLKLFYFILLFYFTVFRLFRAVPVAYGGSQDRGLIGVTAAGVCHSHSHTSYEPHLQPTPHLKAMPGSLTHWARPGIEPVSSWILVGFVATEPQWELLGEELKDLK